MAPFDLKLWQDLLSHLRTHHSDICRQWFDDLYPLSMSGGLLTIQVDNPIHRTYLQKRCLDYFNEAAQVVTGALVAIRFVEKGAGESASPTSPADAVSTTYDIGEDQIVLSPDYCFDHFVTGPENHLAYAASVAVSEKPGQGYNPLFIHGGVGLGKTHLLQAICQTMLARNPQTRICYLSCDTFMNLFIEAVTSGQMNDFRNRYRHVDLLLIDDIHFLTNRERTQEEFFHTFNTLYQSNKQIVLSSDSPPNEIPQLEERLVSRFNWGLVARVDRPCYDTRVAILKKKSAMRDVIFPNDAIDYMAKKINTNIRELEGAITRVQTTAALLNEPITLALTQKTLGDEPIAIPTNQLTIQHVIDVVTKYYDVKLSDLQSKRRQRSISQPRQACMFLARKHTRYSLEEIGGYFGGRDHTTVMHAIKTTEDRLQTDAAFKDQLDHLDQLLVQKNNSPIE